jgi:hypothetical protein
MLLSKHNREKIISFWRQYRKSRRGLAGLLILTIFVLMATLAPTLTPYDPIRDRDLADWLAYPEWVGLFNPEMSDLPTNMKISILNNIIEKQGTLLYNSSIISVNVENNSLIIKSTNLPFNRENLTLITDFKYSFAPPKSFSILILGKLLEGGDNLAIKASFDIIRPDKETIKVWDSDISPAFTRRLKMGEKVYVKSSQPDLLIYLGLPPYRDILAKKVFIDKGQYRLKLSFTFINFEANTSL